MGRPAKGTEGQMTGPQRAFLAAYAQLGNITAAAKAALHWTYAEQAAEAIRIESLIGSVVGQSAPEPPQPGRIARIGRE